MHLHSHVTFILYRAAMLGSILPPVCENSDTEIYFTYRRMCHTHSANTPCCAKTMLPVSSPQNKSTREMRWFGEGFLRGIVNFEVLLI